ncbi:MAG TPA: acyl-ACP--UDP-N-acetylglucosamine O-acyltransferase [Alphaproteobacteria bacterium]|jgi:UDP-N-acetylglucosamine acyltransferase
MPAVHPTAIVVPGAKLAGSVAIGPYCIVGENVALDDGVTLVSHVVVDGHTRIGPKTKVFPFASLGQGPQHLKYAGEPTRLEIGADNVIREHVTMNTGTVMGGGITRVGDRNFFMVNSHVAHDCIVGNNVVMANNAVLGGHVTVGDFCVFGGNAAVHQFVRIGRYAMITGVCGVAEDVIPYGTAYPLYNNRATLAGLNLVGLRRRGFSREQIHTLRTAYRLLFAEEGTLKERLDDVAEMYRDHEAVMEIVNFIRADASRSICLPTTGRQAPA